VFIYSSLGSGPCRARIGAAVAANIIILHQVCYVKYFVMQSKQAGSERAVQSIQERTWLRRSTIAVDGRAGRPSARRSHL